jgi:hypothetical protein
MFYPVIIIFKGAAGIVGRVYIDTFYPSGKFLLQGSEGKEVVAKDKAVVEDVFLAGAMLGVVAFDRVFQQDTGFETGAVFFAYPC